MLPSTLLQLMSYGAFASAHFHVLYPEWRGDSLELETASQWIWPCANVSETTNNTRTPWPTTGGSITINGSHEWAFTYVNLALGSNVTNFNISLVNDFNATGAGVLCLKDNVHAALEEGLTASNITGGTDALDGVDASLQVIQIGHTGSALYNCMDITFSKDAKVLDDEQCKNGTGVGGTAIGASEAQEESPQPSASSHPGAAAGVKPFVGSAVLATVVVMAVALL
ncbi:hypothetical protein BU23DRAFT_13189 [Bimuria novae-zelandiae CBS 107.79]|uniref:Copper acquisition factor BIM1-like domain-containing protein n=1 Tax=Bimuria novae-zelandiae CBS 107.79 TaxID=1447943 RepID=A0A6A5VH00_9PLEO|nr:hypothetical protein BU23DRAFT_13189 [Bimuria novae-zelandiae CBS 107.79]